MSESRCEIKTGYLTLILELDEAGETPPDEARNSPVVAAAANCAACLACQKRE